MSVVVSASADLQSRDFRRRDALLTADRIEQIRLTIFLKESGVSKLLRGSLDVAGLGRQVG